MWLVLQSVEVKEELNKKANFEMCSILILTNYGYNQME